MKNLLLEIICAEMIILALFSIFLFLYLAAWDYFLVEKRIKMDEQDYFKSMKKQDKIINFMLKLELAGVAGLFLTYLIDKFVDKYF